MTRWLILLQLGLFYQVTLGQGATNETLDSKREFTVSHQITERTYDSATYQRVFLRTNETGDATLNTNLLTVLDHGMHYFQDGEFKVSKDLVESFPDGAIARYGAYQTIFSPDLNSPAVFDIQTPDARRIRGGVRAIQLTDLATGNSVVLATIKADVRGELLPPNQVGRIYL